MARFRGDDEASGDWPGEDPLTPEFVIIGDDGQPEPQQRAVTGPRGAATRVGPLLAAVALVAAGVVLGRGSVTVHSGTAQRDTAATVATSTSPTTTGPGDVVMTPGVLPNGPGWPTTTGLCGAANLKPFIDGARPLTEPVDLRIVMGGNPSTVDLTARTISAPLLTAGTPHYVADMASDPLGVVVLMAHCDDEAASMHVIRLATHGEIDIPLKGDTSRASLVSGGNRVWVALPSEGSYGASPIVLAAADFTGDSVTLPAGLAPRGGYGGGGHADQIVGQWMSGGAPLDSFAVVDSTTGAVVREFGSVDRASDTLTEPDMVNATMSGQYVITAPWSCAATCPLRRYRIATGAGSNVEIHPAANHLLAGGPVAISPSGGLAAVALMDQPPSPAAFDPSQHSGTQLSRIGLIRVDDGSVRALPGITLGSGQPPALMFSPDGRWLVVAIADGASTRLLLYTTDGDGPYDPGLAVAGDVGQPLMVPSPN